MWTRIWTLVLANLLGVAAFLALLPLATPVLRFGGRRLFPIAVSLAAGGALLSAGHSLTLLLLFLLAWPSVVVAKLAQRADQAVAAGHRAQRAGLAVLREQLACEPELSRPSMNLEEFFVRVVKEAADDHSPVSAAGPHMAPFLKQ